MAPGGFTHPLLSREGFNKWYVHHAVSKQQPIQHYSSNWQTHPCAPSPWLWADWNDLPSGSVTFTNTGQGTEGEELKDQQSRQWFLRFVSKWVELNVSKSPERGRRGSFTQAIVMTTAIKASPVIDVSVLPSALPLVMSKRLSHFCTVCTPVRNVQPNVIHARHFQLSCYPLSDGAVFYFVVKQFAHPLPISSLQLYHTMASLAPPSFLSLIRA